MIPSPTPTEAKGFSALLGNPSFMWLWAAQILCQVADKILMVLAISLLPIYRIPERFASSSGSAILIANTIPAILLGAIAGILVDRYRKKQVMVMTNLLRALAVPLILLLPKEFTLLLLVILAVSTVTQFFSPAEQSIIPLVVPPHNLLTANALFAITQLGAITVGFAIGEPVLSSIGKHFHETGKTLFLSGVYLVAALCCQMMRSPEQRLPQRQGRSINPIPDLQDGLSYLRSNRPVQGAIIQLTLIYSIIAALQVLSIKLGTEIGLKPAQFGFLVAATGVGLVLGAGVLGQLGSRIQNKPLPVLGFAIVSLVLVGYILLKTLAMALTLSIILGFGAALIAVPVRTLIQEKTPEAMRGKVFGFENNVENIALSLPLALAGPLADRFGLDAVLVVLSAAIALATLWVHQHNRQFLTQP
jgi:predicted MFS family arabinose efflux permease